METSTAGKGAPGSWRDWARRAISLGLLIGLVGYVGSFYSWEQIRSWHCGYWCDREEVPHRLLRELLNGERDPVFLPPGVFFKRDYDDDQPVERPAPDNVHHYYARLDAKSSRG